MRSLYFLSVLISSALALFFCGCGQDSSKNVLKTAPSIADPAPDHIVAMVNNTPLTWADMEKRASGYLKDDIENNHLIIPSNRLDEAKEYFRRKSIKAFVFKTIMMEEAALQGIKLVEADRQEGLRSLAFSLKTRNWTTNDFFKKGPLGEAMMRREFEDGMMIDKLLNINVRSKLKISDKEVADTIILIDQTNALKRTQLEGIRKQLNEGANFEDVARTVSECPSAKKGGDLGEFARGKMLKDLENAAFSQEVGTIGPVIQSRFGYHIVKVTAHSPAQKATASTPAVPETVRLSHILIKSIPVERKRITDSILRTKYNTAVENYYRGLKAKAKIECYLYNDMSF